MGHNLKGQNGKDSGEFVEVKEVIVSSENLSKNRLICSLLESGWVLLDVRVRERRKCSSNGYPTDADYCYLLGRPAEAVNH